MTKVNCEIVKTAIRRLNILAALLLIPVMAAPAFGQQARTLASMDFTIVGVSLQVGPEYQAVPKGIASQVTTGFVSGGQPLPDAVLNMLPKDFKVVGEFTGPTYTTPLTLTTTPGSPIDLPTLPILGKYNLSNLRLVDGSGKALFAAVPQVVTIESISDPIVTSVTTRPLTLQEINDRGVTFDSTNFTVYEFTGAVGVESSQQPITFPALIPNTTKDNPEEPPLTVVGLELPEVKNYPQLPDNFSLTGFVMQPQMQEGSSPVSLPPIPGIIIIPNNIGFLHQYFSALLMVTNGAPSASGLVVKNLTATIGLPAGEDQNSGTDETPGDDPLRMARGASGFFPRTMPVLNAGPDGKAGTADDVSLLNPGETGQADATIEGLKEGTYKIDFTINAILEGLPIGPINIKGKASGAVLVRNPDFSITLGHPATVRSGEAYDLFVTITNTSKASANLVSTHLDGRALSGAVLAPGEDSDKQIETILPGSSATVKYHLISQRTGQVTATAFQSDDASVKGRFILRLGVGENNIPLSPDSLIIPYTGSLPPDVIDAAVGLLGQAWSVATAPAGALPADVLYISKQTVTQRGNDLSEAGLRLLIGENQAKAAQDLTFDFLGSDNANNAFDNLRRRSTQGLNLNNAIAAVFQSEAASVGALAFQASLAEKESYRPGHLSVMTSDAPVRVRIIDALGNRIGGLAAGDAFREIAYGDQLILKEGATGQGAWTGSSLSLVTKLGASSYRLDLKAEADGVFDLGIVVPDLYGSLRQVRFNQVPVAAGALGTVTLLPGTNTNYLLSLDDNGDGVVDRTITATILAVNIPATQAVAAAQIVPGFGPGGDKHGRNIAVLFNKRVTKASAQSIVNYSVEENAVMVSFIQQSGRMAFLQLRDGIGPFFGSIDPVTGHFLGRAITVSGLVDQAGSAASVTQTVSIRITAEGPAAVVSGVVRTAQGAPIPGTTVRLLQQVWKEVLYAIEPVYVIFSEKQVNPDGSYQFDYVLRNDDPPGPFRIEALSPQTNEAGQVTAGVTYHGQQMLLDVFMKAKGSLSGTVRDAAGNSVANATVQVVTLCDSRAYNATTDGSGAYSFTNLRVGAYSLKAVSLTLLAEGTTMGTLPEDGSAVVQDIRIYPALPEGTVTGKVTNLDGTPRPGMIVIIKGERYQNWTRTGADGGYSFSGVYTGLVSVEAKDDAVGEKGTAAGMVTENATTVLNIILKGFGSVACQVTREDGLPAQGFYVIATVNNVSRVAVTDEQGRASFDNVPVGDVTLQVPDPRKTSINFAQGTVTLFAAGDTANITLFIPTLAFSTSTITGTVYKRDGSVWPQAEVMLVIDMDEGKYKLYHADADGKYIIPDPNDPADVLPLGTYNIIVRSGSDIANGLATLWMNGQVKLLNLHATGMGTVTGTIYDQGSGMTPVGADVVLYSLKPNRMGWLGFSSDKPTASVKSDPQMGKYTFTGVYAGPITVSASNIFRPILVSNSGSLVADGDTVTLDLTLQDSFGSFYGQVFLPVGAPAGSGVRVTVRYGGADVTVTTGADGRFAFDHVIPAGTYRVMIEDLVTGLRGSAVMTLPAGQDMPVTIRLLGRGSITVNVVTQTDEAVPGATVKVNGTDFPQDNASGTTDENGLATFSNLSEGTYAVSVMSSNNIGGSAQTIIPADNAVVVVTVKIAASGSVTGRFFKADGSTPIAGGQIKLMNPARQVIGYASSSSDPADLGAFRLHAVPLGDFTLEGYDPITDRKGVGGGKITANGQIVAADVVVTPQGTVRGMVLNNTGTTPVNDATVTINVAGVSPWNFSTVSAPDGSFVFAGVPAGKFGINVTAPINGLAGSASGTITYEGEIAKTEIRLQPSGSIEGKVVMPDGSTPVTNATVSYTNVNTNASGTALQVDALGAYRFTNLAAGSTYRLLAAESGTHRAAKVTVAVNYEGEVVPANITLQGVGHVQGTIYDSDGVTPLVGAAVVLQATGAGGATTASYTDYTNGSGAFAFADVPVGAFTIRGSYPGKETGASGSGTLSSEDQTVTLNLTLGPVGSVTGTVLMADGVTPAVGGIVSYTGCSRTYGEVIGSGGVFILDRIPLCDNFTLYMEDASVTGIGYAYGSLVNNGETVNLGTLLLDAQAIAIASVTPATGTVNVPVDTTVTVAFSEPADPASVSSSSLYLLSGGNRVAGALTLSADHTVATITPTSSLTSFTLYSVVVTTGVRDRVGRALPQTFTSTFTTIDVTTPAVTTISPASGTVEIATDGVVRITFSESIDPAFIDGIRLLADSTPVQTRIDLAQGNTVVILTPLSPLNTNATYTVSISGVRDTVGNIIPAAAAASFTTIDIIAPTVTALTIPANAEMIHGGTVAVTATTADADVAFVDFFVEGQLAVTDAAAPYTQNILLSKEGQITIKAVAQDRVGNRNPDAAHAKEITLTVQPDQPPIVAILAPVDNSTTIAGATITALVQGTDDLGMRELTLSASGEATFTQTRTNLTGKSASSYFTVPVPAGAVPGNTVVLTGSAKDSAGHIGQTAISLTVLADQPPTVAITAPAAGSTVIAGATLYVSVQGTDDVNIREVTLTASGEADFSQTRNNLSGKSYSTTFTVPIPANAVPGNTVQLTAFITDSGDHTGQAAIAVTVTADQPPVVTVVSPAEGSTVNTGSTLTVSVQAADDLFVQEVSLTAAGEVTFSQTITNLSGKNYTANFSIPIPSGAVAGNTIQLTAIARDSGGHTGQAVRNISIHDNITPTVSITSPGQTTRYRPGEAGAATVAATDNIGVASIDCSATGAATGSQTFTINPTQKQVTQAFGFHVLASAAPHAQMTLLCTAQDAVGNQGASNLVLLVADVVAPLTVSATIQNNSTTAPIDGPISVLFNESLAAATVNTNSVVLVVDDGSNQVVAGSVTLSADRKTVTFTPAAPLVKGTKYKLTIARTVTDDAGNALAVDYVLRFTTSYGVLSIQNQGTASAPVMLSPGGYNDISIANSWVKTAGPITVETMDVTNSTLIGKSLITAGTISLANNGVLTHDSATLTETSRLEVWVTTLNIDATSRLDASGRGYSGAWQAGNNSDTGRTYGNTTTGGSYNYSGGSFGGAGGTYNSTAVNAVYGDAQNPDDAGSGGGGWNAGGNYYGGNGGGLVKISAGALTLDGSILSDGGSSYYRGGGSGGGILLSVGTLSGAGSISAKGGGGGTGGDYGAGGGGGRIAIYYTDKAGFTGTVTANGGAGGNGSTVSRNGGAGTIYLKSSADAYGDIVVDNGGRDSVEASTPLPAVGRGVSTDLTANSLTNSLVTWKAGALKGLKINPNINQDKVFTISDNDGQTIYTDPADGDLTQVAAVGNAYTGVYHLNQLSILGKARLLSSDRLVIQNELVVDGGGLHTDNNVITAHQITIKNSGYINHLGATTTTTYQTVLNAVTSFTIDSTSKIDASGRGYSGAWQAGNNSDTGRTYGNTTTGGSYNYSGGSFGGAGGTYNSTAVNAVYGDAQNPDDAGSGGGGWNAGGNYYGGNGGGLVKISAGTLMLDGSILSDGGSSYYRGGGSGGGILLSVGTLSGAGSISAKGGGGGTGGDYGAGGGGGRIAIYYADKAGFTGTVTVNGGLGGSGSVTARNGSVGSIYYQAETNQPPAISISAPTEGGKVNAGSTIDVDVNVADALSLKELTLVSSGAATYSETRNSLFIETYGTTFKLPIPANAVEGNAILLMVTAKDLDDNTTQATRNIFVRDVTAPTTVLTSPGQTVLYRPGQSGTAVVSAADNIGVVSIACAATGSATGSQTFTINPAQTQTTETFGFQVLANAAPYSQYTVSCVAKDADGNQSGTASNLVLTVADIVLPTVVSASIPNNYTTVPIDALINVTFSETLVAAAVNSGSVRLVVDDGSNQTVPGTVTLSADRKTITFTQTAPLAKGIIYKLIITTAVTDDAGNAIAVDYALSFTTCQNTVLIQNQGSASAPFTLLAGTYNDISIANSTVAAKGYILADNITLSNNSVLTNDSTTLTSVRKLELTVTTITIDSTSKIDVMGKGYLGGWQGGNSANTGMTRDPVTGLPTTTGGSTYYGNGGSYGGPGGIFNVNGIGVNAVYGDLMNPDDVGSGGSSSSSNYVGGNGGGLVRITAGALTVDGSIISDGGNAPGYYNSGGGSGGGVLINVYTLAGSGTISAKGGAGSTYYSSGGGGGRIAIYYDTLTLPTTNIIASGGKGTGNGSTAAYNGGAGTIYLKERADNFGDLIVDNGGISTTGVTLVPGKIFASLVVKGSALISLEGGFTSEKDMVVTNTKLSALGRLNFLGNLTLDNSTLTIADRVSATGTISLENQSVLTHAGATLSSQSELDVEAAVISIDNTSRIDVTGRGYLGGYSGGNNSANGRTVGNTTTGGSVTYSGGSYGALGGMYSSYAVNAVYGDLTNPAEIGSGGGACCNGYPGGNGGGLVKIVAGMLTVDGGIQADGGNGSASGQASGGGSGGGVLINVSTLAGAGTISARGGASSLSVGAGGGGRIAIYYDTLTLPAASMIASGGKGGNGSTGAINGGAGTIYLKSNAQTHGDLIVDNAGTTPRDDSTQLSVIGRGTVSALASTSLSNSAATWMPGALKGLKVNPNINQDMTFTVIDNDATTIFIDPADGDLTEVAAIGSTYAGVYSFNKIKVVRKSRARCDERLLIDDGLDVDGGNLIAGGITADKISLTNGGLLSHANATTASVYDLELSALTSLMIDSTSKIDVTNKGYLGGYSGGNNSNTGRTFGNTTTGGSVTYSGGSYGGLGGVYGNYPVSAVYGSALSPNEPGSGGGACCNGYPGGSGGGLVKIIAGTLTVDGGILADGGNGSASGQASGGGSGGGVIINVSSLAGVGAISAKGGGSSLGVGAGGGGRIAIYHNTMTLPTANVMANGGTSSNAAYNGGAGTIYYQVK